MLSGWDWHNLGSKAFKVAKNKYLEIELLWDAEVWFAFMLNWWKWKGHDHAGPFIIVGICGLKLEIKVFDCRHWDYDNNCWQTYENWTDRYDKDG